MQATDWSEFALFYWHSLSVLFFFWNRCPAKGTYLEYTQYSRQIFKFGKQQTNNRFVCFDIKFKSHSDKFSALSNLWPSSVCAHMDIYILIYVPLCDALIEKYWQWDSGCHGYQTKTQHGTIWTKLRAERAWQMHQEMRIWTISL